MTMFPAVSLVRIQAESPDRSIRMRPPSALLVKGHPSLTCFSRCLDGPSHSTRATSRPIPWEGVLHLLFDSCISDISRIDHRRAEAICYDLITGLLDVTPGGIPFYPIALFPSPWVFYLKMMGVIPSRLPDT